MTQIATAPASPPRGSALTPVVDLRDGAVTGYDAAGADVEGLSAAAPPDGLPLCLDGGLEAAAGVPVGRRTLVLRLSAAAVAAQPARALRALARARSAGWGVALDGLGDDPCALALLPVVAPDLIRLDVAALEAMEPARAAWIAGAVAAEAESRRATVHAVGLDTPARVAGARAYGAELGSGPALAGPGGNGTSPGRRLRLTSGAGDPDGPPPWERVTNWRRPVLGTCAEAERAASLVLSQAGAHAAHAAVLATSRRARRSAGRRASACASWQSGRPSPASWAAGDRGAPLRPAGCGRRGASRCSLPASPPASWPVRPRTAGSPTPRATTASWSPAARWP